MRITEPAGTLKQKWPAESARVDCPVVAPDTNALTGAPGTGAPCHVTVPSTQALPLEGAAGLTADLELHPVTTTSAAQVVNKTRMESP